MPEDIYGTFADTISQASVQRIFQAVASASEAGVERAHILFQSPGGFISDGICLYNFFKVMPMELTLYNGGSVQSIAALAFLGAKHRKVSASATFQMHRASFAGPAVQAPQLEALAESARIDDARTEQIFRSYLTLPEGAWERLNYRELFFLGEDAVKCGFADEVADFHVPPGAKVFNI